MPRIAVMAALLLALLATACGQPDQLDPSEESPGQSEPSATVTTTATPATGTDSPARTQLAWVVAMLNDPTLTTEEYDERFADAFRDQVPYADFLAITQQAAASAPFTLQNVDEAGTGLIATVMAVDGTEVLVNLSTDPDGRINGLLLQPAEPPELDNPPATIEEAFERLRDHGTTTAVAARIEQGADQPECVTIAGADPDQPAPIGSAFKLYVLGAVADAVEFGDLGWTDTLILSDADISLPSGTLQNEPVGTEVTVREAAGAMISISDNTATDLLIRAVGREAVEAGQAGWGHHDPALNVPFLTTRELFVLKTADAGTQDAYIAGDVATRRQILEQLASVDLLTIDLGAFMADPVRPDELEWFATPLDLCRVLARLLEASERPGLAPLADILTGNPGVPATAGRWDQIAFKGGSEPGLITMAWAVTDDAGHRYALTGSVVNPDEAFDPGEAILLLAAARDLLPG